MTLDIEMKEQLIQRGLAGQALVVFPLFALRGRGSALLTRSGKIYDGVNVENAAFPSTICAERVAVFKAVSEGEREFTAIAVVTENGGSPCGGCRQVLAEFGLDTLVILIANAEGKQTGEYAL